jgi:ribonuclease HIII
MTKRSGSEEEKGPAKKTLYTIQLNREQGQRLQAYCRERFWEPKETPYAVFSYIGNKLNVTWYTSGKLVIQGKGTEDFVRDVLEPQVTGEALLGYDEVHHPDWYEDHAGLDESGKGDLFGPLVSACVIADGDMIRDWVAMGIRDSKKVGDKQAKELAAKIRKTKGAVVETTWSSMAKYNEMMAKPRANLNLLLAWMHAKSLENALGKRSVPWGLLDQFSKQPLVQRYFKGKEFELRMRTKAESDPVVAAASIVARALYLEQLERLSEQIGVELPKGSGAQAKQRAIEIVRKHGPDTLPSVAKMHFKTAKEALAEGA